MLDLFILLIFELFILILLGLGLVNWFARSALDRRNIIVFFRRRGERVRSVRRVRASRGWPSYWCSRHYVVEYDDAEGISHTVCCRTNRLTGLLILTDEDDASRQ